MIHLKRPTEEPAVLKSKAVQIFRKQLGEFYDTKNTKANKQKKSQLMSDELAERMIKELAKTLPNRCAYCERELDFDQLTFDHFRPTSQAKGYNSEFSEKHYWWLACRWQNLLLSCSDCNRAKSSWFPVKGKRAAVNSTIAQVRKENALLIDPYYDEPSEHLAFIEDGTIVPFSDKGSATLEILQLNRRSLVQQRYASVQTIHEQLAQLKDAKDQDNPQIRQVLIMILRDIKKVYQGTVADISFTGFKRYYYLKFFKDPETRSLLLDRKKSTSQVLNTLQSEVEHLFQRYQKKETKTSKSEVVEQTHKGRIYMENITITNFKGIEHISIDFPESSHPEKKGKLNHEPMLMLLGENGMGKSTILQAILLALAGQSYINKLKLEPKELILSGKKPGPPYNTAEIIVHFKGEKKPVKIIINDKKISSTLSSPAGFVLGYGAGRMPKTRRLKPEIGKSMVRAENLFFHDTSLIDYNTWLCSLPQEYFDRVAKALKELMLLDNNDKIERDIRAKRVYKSDRKSRISIESLSDGYRSVFTLACDIMEKLVKEKSTIEVAEGVVLIDEIGTHLHPRWRMQVVKRMRDVFPKVQFIVTTHDPLCLKGTKKGEVLVLNKEPETDRVVIMKDLPDPSPMRADQLLASPFFGLSTTVDENAEALFNEYYYLLALQIQRQLTPKENEKLQTLQNSLDELSVMGKTTREKIMLKAIDKTIVESKFKEDSNTRLQLEEDTVNQLVEFLKEDNV